MILGNLCTRGCGFCSVPKGSPHKQEFALDPDEPANVARMAARMRLRYVVITSVNRDDLADGGSRAFRRDRARSAGGASASARRSADSGFLRRHGRCGARAGCRSARVQSQHGDHRAFVPARASRKRIIGNRSTCFDSRERYRPDVLTKSGLMVGLGEQRRRSARASARSAGRRCRRGHHRAVSATHAAQSAGGQVRYARRVRRIPRLRAVDRIQNGLQWAAGRSSYMADRVNEEASHGR